MRLRIYFLWLSAAVFTKIKLLLKVRPVAMIGRSSISFDVERFLVSVLPELINL